jgi:hypothetical protein
MLELTLLVHTQFFEDVFHQAPSGKGRLQEIDSYKGGKEKPVPVMEIAQSDGDQNERAGNSANPLFHFHGFVPPILMYFWSFNPISLL